MHLPIQHNTPIQLQVSRNTLSCRSMNIGWIIAISQSCKIRHHSTYKPSFTNRHYSKKSFQIKGKGRKWGKVFYNTKCRLGTW